MRQDLISNITTSTKTFGKTVLEGIQEAKVEDAQTMTVQPSTNTNIDYSKYAIQFVEAGLPIILAIVFCKTVKGRIQRKEKFSGLGWALANGLLGGGFLWVIIAHSSINKEIAGIKDKKYKKYVQLQMKDFVKVYSVCVICWVVIWLIITLT